MSEGGGTVNRLARESSPYLRLHAGNPVDWYPWGREAIERARREDRPIFLSVGYSSCHWCHVMAHESFEDADTAAVMNRLFVNVKVDREERPDVDAVYMDAVQALAVDDRRNRFAFHQPINAPVFLENGGDGFLGRGSVRDVERAQLALPAAALISDNTASASADGCGSSRGCNNPTSPARLPRRARCHGLHP